AGIMALRERINLGGTTILMATHDAGIVDKMKRRVIELSAGRVMRDERHGGYQTQVVPVQHPEQAPGSDAGSGGPGAAPSAGSSWREADL
ncbi:MAG TPA: hypothetical protein PK781_10690, partial [Terrimesophilobacter sp.]|nr:hypothetical protein [Terrimesophilobacter sp.]